MSGSGVGRRCVSHAIKHPIKPPCSKQSRSTLSVCSKSNSSLSVFSRPHPPFPFPPNIFINIHDRPQPPSSTLPCRCPLPPLPSTEPLPPSPVPQRDRNDGNHRRIPPTLLVPPLHRPLSSAARSSIRVFFLFPLSSDSFVLVQPPRLLPFFFFLCLFWLFPRRLDVRSSGRRSPPTFPLLR